MIKPAFVATALFANDHQGIAILALTLIAQLTRLAEQQGCQCQALGC